MYFYSMGTRYFKFLIISATLTAIIALGCSKNEDTEFPEITAILPTVNSAFNNGDTIHFRALISDNTQLTGVSIQLVDLDNKPVLAAVNAIPVTNPFLFTGEYIIDDPLLPGGKYNLRFQANDGVNTSNRFVEVQVYEMARQLLYPVIVTNPQANTWYAYRLLETAKWKEFAMHTGDYCGSGINSETAQFYFCGKYKSDLKAVKLPEGIPVWKVKPGFNASQRWFEGTSFNPPNLYTSCFEGNILGYDKYGSTIYKSDIFLNGYPYLSVLTKNFILGAFKDDFSTNRYLVGFHNQGGKMIFSKFFQNDVIGLINSSADKVLVFSNTNEFGDISVFNGADNTLFPLRIFTGGTFREVAGMDSDTYYISTSAGIYRYQLSKNTLTAFETKTSNAEIACDPLARNLYSCKENTLTIYSTPSAELVNSFSLPDGVIDLYLLFNK